MLRFAIKHAWLELQHLFFLCPPGPSTTERHWPSAMRVNKRSYFKSFTRCQIRLCAAVAPQAGPQGSTCCSGAHYKCVLGPFPGSLNRKRWSDAQKSVF